MPPQDPTQEMAWGDDPSDAYRRVRLHVQANQKARVAVLDEKVIKAQVHFNRFYFYCLGENCPACALKEPSPRYLSWVFQYNTDANGRPTSPLGGAVKAWLFGRDKYGALAAIREEWGDLRKLDLLIECTDVQYQRFAINAARECFWQTDTNFAQTVIAMYQATKVPAIDVMARTVTPNAMESLLRGRVEDRATTAQAATSTLPVQGIADAVVGMTGPVGPQKSLADLLAQLSGPSQSGT